MKNLFIFIRQFLWHQISASTRYRIHSPYLYNFLNEILRGKPDQKVIRLYREERKKNQNQNSVFSLKKAQVMVRLLVLLKPDQSVVYGDSSKFVNKLISEFAPKSQIHKMEGLELQSKEKDLGVGFDVLKSVDFAFYDASNNVDEVRTFFEKCSLKKGQHSVLIFNSMYRTNEMKKAWIEIMNHPEIMVSIDLFSFGMVIFKQGLSRQQIKYRY